MNKDQFASFARWLLNGISGGVIAYTAAKSPAAQTVGAYVSNLITGPDVVASIVAGCMWLWGHLTHSKTPSSSSGSTTASALLLVGALAATMTFSLGCKANLEAGGAYNPATLTTNTDGTITTNATPQTLLYQADASYKLAYDVVDGVFKWELQNRDEIQAKFPLIKKTLDNIRPVAWNIDQRWAAARKAYIQNPTPANLTTVQGIVTEIGNLVEVAQSQMAIPLPGSLTNSVSQ